MSQSSREEQLRELVEKWRKQAENIKKQLLDREPGYFQWLECNREHADELEAILAQPAPAEVTQTTELLVKMAKAMYAVHQRLEFYTERETCNPGNHQEFAREAREQLLDFGRALSKYNEWAKVALAAVKGGGDKT